MQFDDLIHYIILRSQNCNNKPSKTLIKELTKVI